MENWINLISNSGKNREEKKEERLLYNTEDISDCDECGIVFLKKEAHSLIIKTTEKWPLIKKIEINTVFLSIKIFLLIPFKKYFYGNIVLCPECWQNRKKIKKKFDLMINYGYWQKLVKETQDLHFRPPIIWNHPQYPYTSKDFLKRFHSK